MQVILNFFDLTLRHGAIKVPRVLLVTAVIVTDLLKQLYWIKIPVLSKIETWRKVLVGIQEYT
jgi:hypothetical protein